MLDWLQLCAIDNQQSSKDGGSFAVTWWNADPVDAPILRSDAPVVLMLPGVVGKADNVYIKRCASCSYTDIHLLHVYILRTTSADHNVELSLKTLCLVSLLLASALLI
jgi:hypothetical protein